jgi:hypothetical protein
MKREEWELFFPWSARGKFSMETIHDVMKTKGRLLKDLERVSDTDIREISNFVEFLMKKRQKKRHKKTTLAPKNDPVLKLIGVADVEPFSTIIDRELYAE